MYKKKIPITEDCGLDLIREVLYGKWKIHLLYYISIGNIRPSQLQKQIPEASRRVLNMQLNQLEDHELISKKIYQQVPPKVEYSLSDFGQSLLPLIITLGNWGDENKERLQAVISKSTNR